MFYVTNQLRRTTRQHPIDTKKANTDYQLKIKTHPTFSPFAIFSLSMPAETKSCDKSNRNANANQSNIISTYTNSA